MNQELITVNCIGAGRWGPNLIRALRNIPRVRVCRVADRDAQRLELIAQRFPEIRTTTDVDSALTDEEADAIVIATPVRTHYDLARRALECDKHVLVEKPLCGNAPECRSLTDLADELRLVLAVGHVFLFNPGIRKVREILESGALGKIYYIHATRTNLGPIREDVNALWDLASHDLSIFQYWLDAVPQEVTAHGESFLHDGVEDVVVASYRYPDNILACVHASWLNPRKVREITVVGDRKMIVWSDMDVIEPVRLYDKNVQTRRDPEYADSLGGFQTQIRDGDVLIPHVAGGEPVAAECEHFIQCIREDRRPLNHAGLATDVVHALEATDESMRRNGAMVNIGAPRHSGEARSPVERTAVGALT